MKNLRALALLLLALPAAARPLTGGLTLDEARLRRAMIGAVDYGLTFNVDAERLEFDGQAAIDFKLNNADDDLTLDFDSGTIKDLWVNGVKLARPDYNGKFVVLDKKLLKTGANSVLVSFIHSYDRTGVGLYRFKDPEDGRVYLYSMFEPYDANKMFPCFDQPDLKATFRLVVNAPKDWQVVSGSPVVETADNGTVRTTIFKLTSPMSTYVFSLHAGPYHVWSDQAGPVPIRLFARESLAKYVDAKEWFEYTKQGLDFYGKYFDYPYPFEKYDQLMVPDFNHGGMENIGAVTYSERFLHRSKPTLTDREHLAGVLLHEMAHQWFGDLVTLDWWNGTWLNETFATYMGTLCTAEATRHTRAWQSFFMQKKYTYWQDQLETTHPIESPVADTDSAFANFDGITYGKGASAMKQLAFWIGRDKFRDGVRAYLKRHAFSNATEGDFFGAMGEASGLDLKDWTKRWLDTAGVNTVGADYVCGTDGKLASFALVQTASPRFPVLRPHRTEVAFYAQDKKGALKLARVESVAYDGERTEVAALKGAPCPALVYPNHEDYDYAKAELGALSLAAAKAGLGRVGDPMVRLMLWQSLWDMVQDVKWPVTDYLEAVLSGLAAEQDVKVAQSVLGTVGRVLHYLPRPDYARLEDFLWSRAVKAPRGGDLQKVWYDAFASVAKTAKAQGILRAMLSNKPPLKGLVVDQDRRWDILVQLSGDGTADADKLVEAELSRDPSDRGRKSAIAARAARPDLAVKKAAFERITSIGRDGATLGEVGAAIGGLFPLGQDEFRAKLGPDFYAALPALSDAQQDDFLGRFTALAPALCTPESAAALAGFVNSHPKLKADVLKDLRTAREDDERCLRIRALIPK